MLNIKKTVNFTRLNEEKETLFPLENKEVLELVSGKGLHYVVSAEHLIELYAQIAALTEKVTGTPQPTINIDLKEAIKKVTEKSKRIISLVKEDHKGK